MNKKLTTLVLIGALAFSPLLNSCSNPAGGVPDTEIDNGNGGNNGNGNGGNNGGNTNNEVTNDNGNVNPGPGGTGGTAGGINPGGNPGGVTTGLQDQEDEVDITIPR